MNILVCLTYYRPHYSGLTIYAERLARALVNAGHGVSVLTSRYDKSLPSFQEQDGVKIIRLPVRMRVSKGVIMPAMLFQAARLARHADVIHLHVPQLDASYISLMARLTGKPVVLTYHCDLVLPKGMVHKLANQVSHIANHLSALAANVIVTNTRDYAEHSPFLRHYLHKVTVIQPPVELPPVTDTDLADMRQKISQQPGEQIIVMAARLATEKGVEFLVQALPGVLEEHPKARVLFVGQHEDVFGEKTYAQKLAPLIERLGKAWNFLGVLPSVELSAVFHLADVLVLPSINSTESYGMVQVEAMTCGTPVVATDLPGIRQPVAMTGMGLVVPPQDAPALAKAIKTILNNPQAYRGNAAAVAERFSSGTIAKAYEQVYDTLVK
ncbi:MAG: glycosyltransferase family 4 protein [Anaerolineales bacterium]|nr:glycosyltransferase family 4 protein [Anaerolineales bacterium]